MDKTTHAKLLRRAMAEKGYDRQVVADATGRGERTVTNWRNGVTLPDDSDMVALRRLFGSDYAEDNGASDEVEVAVRRSPLIRWRQNAVLSEYERHLHEQQATEGVTGA